MWDQCEMVLTINSAPNDNFTTSNRLQNAYTSHISSCTHDSKQNLLNRKIVTEAVMVSNYGVIPWILSVSLARSRYRSILGAPLDQHVVTPSEKGRFKGESTNWMNLVS